MTDWNLFLFGVGISLMCGIGALAPLLYAASKAELDWRERKRQKNNLAALRTSRPDDRPPAADIVQQRRRA